MCAGQKKENDETLTKTKHAWVCNIQNTLFSGTCDISFTWTKKLRRHFQTRCMFGYM